MPKYLRTENIQISDNFTFLIGFDTIVYEETILTKRFRLLFHRNSRTKTRTARPQGKHNLKLGHTLSLSVSTRSLTSRVFSSAPKTVL